MKDYKRLTNKDSIEIENNDFRSYYYRLRELEDKIENGLLVEKSEVAKDILEEFVNRIAINEDSTICLSDILVVAKRYNINIKDLIK